MRGDAGECLGNVREWVLCTRGMPGECMGVGAMHQGNAMVMYGSGCKVPGECRENIWEAK